MNMFEASEEDMCHLPTEEATFKIEKAGAHHTVRYFKCLFKYQII